MTILIFFSKGVCFLSIFSWWHLLFSFFWWRIFVRFLLFDFLWVLREKLLRNLRNRWGKVYWNQSISFFYGVLLKFSRCRRDRHGKSSFNWSVYPWLSEKFVFCYSIDLVTIPLHFGLVFYVLGEMMVRMFVGLWRWEPFCCWIHPFRSRWM